uniref:Uncharacterized protein n=1 Tax=Rhizophora mucronata TaxID=61149 RepID=A0A2P2NDQ5_RHIMU
MLVHTLKERETIVVGFGKSGLKKLARKIMENIVFVLLLFAFHKFMSFFYFWLNWSWERETEIPEYELHSDCT